MKYFLPASLFLLAVPNGSLAAEEPSADADAAGKTAADLDGAESQSYGYGYGTKVADKYSVSTGRKLEKK